MKLLVDLEQCRPSRTDCERHPTREHDTRPPASVLPYRPPHDDGCSGGRQDERPRVEPPRRRHVAAGETPNCPRHPAQRVHDARPVQRAVQVERRQAEESQANGSQDSDSHEGNDLRVIVPRPPLEADRTFVRRGEPQHVS